MVKIVVTAPRGKMDKLIIQEGLKNEKVKVVGALGPKGRSYIGKDAAMVAGACQEIGAKVYDDLSKIEEEWDVLIDFSTVQLSMEVLEYCIKNHKAIICGTTGFNEAEIDKLKDASKMIPVLKAANTSFMVNVMTKMLNMAAELLKDKCKIEILDMHDEEKLDSPSGTAKELAEGMSEASAIPVSEMDFHSIRAGDISSSHTVYFGGMGERLEVTHHAYDWRSCARGALEAAIYMLDRPKGFYTMEDVIDS